jgi:replicative DNA helicase
MYRESHKDVKKQLYSKIECIYLKNNFIFATNMKQIENINFWYNLYKESLSGAPEGIRTSLITIDDITGGFKKGKLYCIAGRKGMGCNFLLHQWLVDISLKQQCLYISNTHRYDILIPHMNKYLESLTNISNKKLSDQNFKSLKLDYGYRPKYFIEDVLDEIKEKYNSNPFDVLFLDDIQDIYMSKSLQTRDAELKKICIELKSLAYELNFAIVYTAKLKRATCHLYKINDPLDKIKDSSAIEDISDYIFVLDRPAYYNHYEPVDCEGSSLKNTLYITLYHNTEIYNLTLITDFSQNRIIDYASAIDLYKTYVDEDFGPFTETPF